MSAPSMSLTLTLKDHFKIIHMRYSSHNAHLHCDTRMCHRITLLGDKAIGSGELTDGHMFPWGFHSVSNWQEIWRAFTFHMDELNPEMHTQTIFGNLTFKVNARGPTKSFVKPIFVHLVASVLLMGSHLGFNPHFTWCVGWLHPFSHSVLVCFKPSRGWLGAICKRSDGCHLKIVALYIDMWEPTLMKSPPMINTTCWHYQRCHPTPFDIVLTKNKLKKLSRVRFESTPFWTKTLIWHLRPTWPSQL